MNSTSNRLKDRRKYLRKKINLIFSGALSAFLFLPALILAIGSAIFTLLALFASMANPDRRLLVVPLGMLTLIAGSVARWQWCAMKEAASEAKRLTYVPPVASSMLLPEEVLVRSANEPQQNQADMLLRATKVNDKTPAEQLLRSIHNVDGDNSDD